MPHLRHTAMEEAMIDHQIEYGFIEVRDVGCGWISDNIIVPPSKPKPWWVRYGSIARYWLKCILRRGE